MSERIRVVIADDEPLAREGLSLLLANEVNVELVGSYENGNDAVAGIRALRPDLVLLDIQMPGLSGLEVVAGIGPAAMPQVIFLTAHADHAIEAFELHALDYLLKPVSDARFRASLQRARMALQHHSSVAHQQQLSALLQQLAHSTRAASNERLMIRSAGHVHFLKPADISWIQAEGDYVTIHTTGKAHLLRETLKQMEERLRPQGFQRIHRSSLVNLDAIRELIASDSGDYQVILQDSTRLKLSRVYREELCERLQASVAQVYK